MKTSTYCNYSELTQAISQIALDTLCETKPDLVLLTSEFNDAHGTHEKCGRASERAAQIYVGKEDGKAFEEWNYRNRDTARQLQTLGLLPPSRSFAPIYAEVFRRQL